MAEREPPAGDNVRPLRPPPFTDQEIRLIAAGFLDGDGLRAAALAGDLKRLPRQVGEVLRRFAASPTGPTVDLAAELLNGQNEQLFRVVESLRGTASATFLGEAEAFAERQAIREADGPEKKAKKGIPLIRACDAVEKPVQWVIERFLARGELTDLSGDPGMGKGLISTSWAAQVTRALPDATVIFFATEDPLGRLKARLRAEGADLARILFLDITQSDASPILPGDVAEVEAIVRENRTALLVLDPALEFMDGSLDSYKQADVARFTGPLLAMAMRTDAALLTVRHNTKAVGSSALHRASGSIGFSGKARIVLTAAKNHDTGERALAMVKNNLGTDRLTVAYDIVAKDGASVIAWGDVIPLTADELVNQEPGKKIHGPAPAKLEAAVDLLRDILATGPMKVDDVMRRAKAEGISRSRMYLARDALKVARITLDLSSGWKLPENATRDELSRSGVGNSGQLGTTRDNGAGDDDDKGF